MKGKWLVEANTNFGVLSPANTSVSVYTSNGTTLFKIGGEAGYFVANNLAIKLGLGVTSASGGGNSASAFNYEIGAKYYIASMFPVQVDFNGLSASGSSTNAIGLQGGYAWFVAPNVSIEPGIRYDFSTEQGGDGLFSGNIGFALHF